MFNFITTTFLIFFFQFCFGQTAIKTYVTKHIKEISSIDPANQDYSDLQVIGNAIGNASIVMLGEQDHGDAPTFLAKTRLIKYLHEKKGFNVLAFESDFFGLNYGWESVKKSDLSSENVIKLNISALWTYCDGTKYLFNEYIPTSLKTANPLIITGFDNQLGTEYLMPLLDSLLRSLQLPITNLPEYSSQIFPLLAGWYKYTEDSATVNKIIAFYHEIKSQMTQKLSSDDFWVKTIENLIAQNIQYKYRKTNYWKSFNTRDRQMALNLKWITEIRYPNEKIIVWAHNFHVSKNSGNYREKFLKEPISMTSIFTADSIIMSKVYIIGFTSYQGTTGRLFQNNYPVQNPKRNSFENWIDKSYNYAFVDFKTYNRSNPIKSENFYLKGSLSGNLFHKNFKTEWTKVFDGVFYLKNMYPCAK
jgi:erythromycin esterase-like protein